MQDQISFAIEQHMRTHTLRVSIKFIRYIINSLSPYFAYIRSQNDSKIGSMAEPRNAVIERKIDT